MTACFKLSASPGVRSLKKRVRKPRAGFDPKNQSTSWKDLEEEPMFFQFRGVFLQGQVGKGCTNEEVGKQQPRSAVEYSAVLDGDRERRGI